MRSIRCTSPSSTRPTTKTDSTNSSIKVSPARRISLTRSLTPPPPTPAARGLAPVRGAFDLGGPVPGSPGQPFFPALLHGGEFVMTADDHERLAALLRVGAAVPTAPPVRTDGLLSEA